MDVKTKKGQQVARIRIARFFISYMDLPGESTKIETNYSSNFL